MEDIKSVCIYCGSSIGRSESLQASVVAFGRILADEGIRLVYGGGGIGLMGTVSGAVLDAGGTVTGVIPKFLDELERGNRAVTELIRVDNMHERKRTMFELSDAFVALPGGLGTLEELLEIITWRQLRLHDKPIVIANLESHWSSLESLFDAIIERGFARPTHRDLYTVVDDIADILPAIRAARGGAVEDHPERL